MQEAIYATDNGAAFARAGTAGRRCARVVLMAAVMTCATLATVSACGGGDGSAGSAGTPVGRHTIPPASSLPAGFPTTFPVFEGSRVTAAETRADGFVVDLDADADAASVTAFYQGALDATPWQIVDTQTPGAGITIFEFTGDAFDGTLTVASGQTTRLLLNLRQTP